MADIFKGPVDVEKKKREENEAKGKFKGPVKPKDDAPEGFDFLGATGNFVNNTLSNFNDAVTFGLYDDFLRETKLDPDATTKLKTAKKDIAANLVGTTAGYMIPGMALESITAKAIPALANNAIPAVVGRNALASGELSTMDQFAREGKVDLGRVAVDSAAGGALSGALAAILRYASPEARIRAMGNDITELDRAKALAFADYAEGQGLPLTSVEALNAMSPETSGSVRAGWQKAAKSPGGSQVIEEFNARRTPDIRNMATSFVSEILGGGKKGVSGVDAAKAATEALGEVKSGFKTTADPLYAAAESRKVPPSWLKKTRGGYTEDAMKSVAKDAGMIKGLIAQNGGQVPAANSVLFLDSVKKELDAMVKGFQKGERGNRAGFAADEAAALTEQMDKVAPTYAPAREISEQGGDVLSSLEAGPLGTISNASNLSTQSNALFGVTNEAGVEAAIEAAKHLPDDVNLGILANHIQTAAAKTPENWANKALPNDASASVADEILRRAGMEDVTPKLTAARAVNLKSPDPFIHDTTGPGGSLWQAIRDYGKSGVAKKLTEKKSIQKFGRMGTVQSMINDILSGGVATSSNQRADEPLEMWLR